MPKSSQILKVNILTACALATFVGLLGLWPHVAFMNEIGEFRYFHGAFDEDTYILGWMRGTLRSTRLLSGAGLDMIYGLAGPSIDTILVVSDFVIPFLTTCAAYFAASQLSAFVPARVLISLLLVFANDLFSLGNVAIWNSAPLTLEFFSALVGRFLAENLVPPYETSYLAVFRTPEPQLSFALMFVILGLLARSANSPSQHPIVLAALLLVTLLLPFGYTFITFPVALIAAGCAGVFAVTGRRRAAAAIAVGLLGALALFAAVSSWQQGAQSSFDLANSLAYPSRLPIVTPGVLASVVFGGGFGLLFSRGRRREPIAFLALGCLLAPAALCNQQIVTGVMISARDWERNFDYPAIVFGLCGALATLRSSAPGRLARSRFLGAFALCIAVILVVVNAQKRSIQLWMPHNLESVAAVRALASVHPSSVAGSSVVLESGALGPLVQLRTGGAIDTILDFYKVGVNLVPNMAKDASHADPSPYEEMVFAYWLRTGKTAAEAEQILRTEIERRAGLFSNFLFSFRDGWYPSSDNRAVRQDELERSVDSIIARYGRYLIGAQAQLLAQPSLLVSASNPEKLRSPTWISNEHVGWGQAGHMTKYVYRQRPGSTYAVPHAY